MKVNTLTKTYTLIKEKGFGVINIDCTICLEKPKISSFIPEMRKTISSLIDTETDNVAIKATTTEQLGFYRQGRRNNGIGCCPDFQIKFLFWRKLP